MLRSFPIALLAGALTALPVSSTRSDEKIELGFQTDVWIPIERCAFTSQPTPAPDENLPPVIPTPAPDSSTDSTGDVPTLPETVVTGRAEAFPVEQLGRDTLVTPNRGASTRESTGSSVSLITEQDIRATQQTSVAEVLRSTLGLDVVRRGGPGGQTSLFLRGGNSGHTKVLLDGIPLNDPAHPTRAFDFSQLSTDNVQRIEVLRGPQSMVYGSDAIGGVINIISKRGSGPMSVVASGMGGSFGTAQTSLSASGGDQCVYYSVTGSWLHTDGISAASRRNGNTERDRHQNGTVSGRVGWTLSDAVNVDYTFRYIDTDTEIDNFTFANNVFAFADDPAGRLLAKTFYQRLQLQSFLLDGGIEQRIGFNFTDYGREDRSPTAFDTDVDGRTRQLDYVLDMLLTESNSMTAGFDYTHEHASVLPSQGAQDQAIAGVFLQDNFQFGERLFGTAGVRWDDHSSAGAAQTYRFTGIYHLNELGSSFHASLGRGFRAPSLVERFGGTRTLFPYGNPLLRPERSKGYDFGVETLLTDDLTMDFTYFRNDFTDLINFGFDPNSGSFRNVNIGQARTSGVELSLLWQASVCTHLTANYTLTDTVDHSTNTELLLRPQDKASVGIHHRLYSIPASLHYYLHYVGRRYDFGGIELGDFFLANLSADLQLTDQVELFARIDNLYDADYEEAAGYGSAGFSGYAGMNISW